MLLGLFRLGILAVLLSDQLVEGLTTGAAVHIFTSQIKHLTGIASLSRDTGTLGAIKVQENNQSKVYKVTRTPINNTVEPAGYLALRYVDTYLPMFDCISWYGEAAFALRRPWL